MKKSQREIHRNLATRMVSVQQVVSPFFTAAEHSSDSVYFVLTRLVLISDEARNLQKVDSVLQLILVLWLNNSNFINCANKNAMSQLCQLFINLSQINKSENPQRALTLETAMSTMLYYCTRAKQLNIFNEIRLSSEDLQAIKSLI